MIFPKRNDQKGLAMRFARSMRVTFATAVIGGLAAGLCTGCSSSGTGASSGAPALTVCGQTLWDAAAGATLVDLTTDDAKIMSASDGYQLFFKLSGSCQGGASLTWAPSSAAKIVRSVRTADGKLAAVILQPLAKVFTLTLTSSAGKETRIPVSLPALPSVQGTRSASATPTLHTSP